MPDINSIRNMNPSPTPAVPPWTIPPSNDILRRAEIAAQAQVRAEQAQEHEADSEQRLAAIEETQARIERKVDVMHALLVKIERYTNPCLLED